MFTAEKSFQDWAVDEKEEHFETKSEMVVVHTTAGGTRSALRAAAILGDGLYSHIRLIAPRVVPYPLSLFTPPVSKEFTEHFFIDLVAGIPANTQIDIRICRDAVEMLRAAIRPGSLVVIGKRSHWWPGRESALAKALRRMGHVVLLSEIY